MLVYHSACGLPQQSRGQLAVGGGDGENFVAVLFHGPGLVDADVPAGGGDHRLPGPQVRPDGRLVHLGAAHQKVDGGVGRAAQPPDGLLRLAAVRVGPVARGQLQVGLDQRLQYGRVCACAVVVAEIQHGGSPPFAFSQYSKFV